MKSISKMSTIERIDNAVFFFGEDGYVIPTTPEESKMLNDAGKLYQEAWDINEAFNIERASKYDFNWG